MPAQVTAIVLTSAFSLNNIPSCVSDIEIPMIWKFYFINLQSSVLLVSFSPPIILL